MTNISPHLIELLRAIKHPIRLPILLALVQREAGAARVSILREGGIDRPVTADRVQIQQVLVNLLMNAIQAMQSVGGRVRALRISVEADGAEGEAGMARIAVEDSGNGISGEPASIFEPFFTTKRDGMGLGLSIFRSNVEAQGGPIAAANNAGFGATISFTLPLAPAAGAAHEAATETSV